MAKATPRFPKGSDVSHPAYKKAKGIVTKVDAKNGLAYVEWIGFPPNVPTDGWIYTALIAPTPK